jgi:hypothetical protein
VQTASEPEPEHCTNLPLPSLDFHAPPLSN